MLLDPKFHWFLDRINTLNKTEIYIKLKDFKSILYFGFLKENFVEEK